MVFGDAVVDWFPEIIEGLLGFRREWLVWHKEAPSVHRREILFDHGFDYAAVFVLGGPTSEQHATGEAVGRQLERRLVERQYGGDVVQHRQDGLQ